MRAERHERAARMAALRPDRFMVVPNGRTVVESFAQYRKRRAKRNAAIAKYLRGTVFWNERVPNRAGGFDRVPYVKATA